MASVVLPKSVGKPEVFLVIIAKDARLTAGTATDVDFSPEIAANTPNGYMPLYIIYDGAWPKETWNNAIVSKVGGTGTTIALNTAQTQTYAIRAISLYGLKSAYSL